MTTCTDEEAGMGSYTCINETVTEFDESLLTNKTTIIDVVFSGITCISTTKPWPSVQVLLYPKGCIVNLNHFPNVKVINGSING